MANTNPVNDSGAVTEYILERAARGRPGARLSRSAPSRVGLAGERLAEIGEMREAGIVAVSDDGQPIMDSGLMRRALEYSAMFDLPVIAHEEDRGLAGERRDERGADRVPPRPARACPPRPRRRWSRATSRCSSAPAAACTSPTPAPPAPSTCVRRAKARGLRRDRRGDAAPLHASPRRRSATTTPTPR